MENHLCTLSLQICLTGLRCAFLQVPGLAELQRPKDLTLEEGVAGLVKLGFSGLMSLSARL